MMEESMYHCFRAATAMTLIALLLAGCGPAGPTPATPVSDRTGLPTPSPPSMSATTVPSSTSALPAARPQNSLQAELKGSGASFPNQIYQRWIHDYRVVVPSVTINYQSVGSGQGVTDFLNGITDFGATDAFLTDEELAKAPDTLHIPTVVGAVVTTDSLPGVTTLQFSPTTLADIFLGAITRWNDPAIAADNPGVTLPDRSITVVYRADGSGTNQIFTTYLSSVSSAFRQIVGSGKTVNWPVGQGEQKNDGVARAVKSTEGAIGYVELIYALGNKLPAPAIKNVAGRFVTPTLESVTAAAQGFLLQLPDDLRIMIVNPPTGADAYPIAGFTWILVHREMQDEDKALALADFLYWALAHGDEQAKALGYAPLPAEVKARAVDKLEQITVSRAPIFTRP